MGMGDMGLVVMECMMGNSRGRRTPAREQRLWTKESVPSVPGKLANQVFWRSNRDKITAMCLETKVFVFLMCDTLS